MGWLKNNGMMKQRQENVESKADDVVFDLKNWPLKIKTETKTEDVIILVRMEQTLWFLENNVFWSKLHIQTSEE